MRFNVLREWQKIDGKRKLVSAKSGIGQILIHGKPWTIVVVPHRTPWVYGCCDPVINVIFLDGTRSDADIQDSLLHEVKHAIDPKQTERKVLKEANILTTALRDFGYIKKW